MALFEWGEGFAITVPAIDEQHRQLIGWINALHDAVEREEGEQIIDETLHNLIVYVLEHFSDEERMLLAANYPGYPGHRQEHDFFVGWLKESQATFMFDEDMSRNTLEFMVDWIVGHIQGTDSFFGQFLHSDEQ